MELNSEIEFPPLEACLKGPHHFKSNASTPSAGLNSSLNASAQAFTPRSTINFSNCLGSSTPEQLPQINVEMVGEGDVNIGAGGDGTQLENNLLNQSKTRLNSNIKTNSSGRRHLPIKRRLSLTSIANTTISSIDTNISDKLENEGDDDVLARREKNIQYGKRTGAYERYIQVIPRRSRDQHSPRTPIKDMKYSRRQWDGLVKHWKIKLHDWDRNSNDVPKHPSSSTPKRLKTKCDRRSLGNSTPLNTTSDQKIGGMLPPSIRIMFSNENKVKEQNETQDEGKQNSNLVDWSQNSGTERVMDWSKECETSEDETEQDEHQNKEENLKSKDEDGQVTPTNYEARNVQNDESKQASSKNEDTEIVANDKAQKSNDDEEGMVYTCVSLVEAIAQFDEKTYNEDDDEDYVPPEQRGLTLEEIGNDASDEDSDDSSDARNLFYQVVQRNKHFKL